MQPRFVALVAIIALVASGCGVPFSTPGAVEPTLTALERHGFDCDSGEKDMVPSGLFQWHCRGSDGGVETTVLVNGNDAGVAEIDDVYESTNPVIAIDGFRRLVANVPPLTAAPDLANAIADWTGAQQSVVVRGVRVSAECDVTQCLIFVSNAESPIQPLPLP